ncbi:hypothetical protein ACPPVO_24040 [Dactylosporangium sp. McL0621]|uniref:hypothetical protein n=1 Tax=Dactylosporangium sp. McL0621 TaxID=3415678 RepID=UPI003CF78795
MLDGWIAATHCHDGTNRDILLPRLGGPAAAAAQRTQLCDPTAAVLEARPLLHPFRNGCAWNPADERYDAFRIVPRPSPPWTIRCAAAIARRHYITTAPGWPQP